MNFSLYVVNRKVFLRSGFDFVTVIIFCEMSGNKKKKPARPIFDAIRKPTAPPSRKIGKIKPEEKIHPSLRKIKHRKEEDLEGSKELDS